MKVMAYSCDLCLQSLAEIQRGDWGGGGRQGERKRKREQERERTHKVQPFCDQVAQHGKQVEAQKTEDGSPVYI